MLEPHIIKAPFPGRPIFRKGLRLPFCARAISNGQQEQIKVKYPESFNSRNKNGEMKSDIAKIFSNLGKGGAGYYGVGATALIFTGTFFAGSNPVTSIGELRVSSFRFRPA